MTLREQRGWLFSDAINAFDDIIYLFVVHFNMYYCVVCMQNGKGFFYIS